MFWIAFAGPLSNFCLAFLGTAVLALLSLLPGLLFSSIGVMSGPYAYATGNSTFLSSLEGANLVLQAFIYINLLLGFFNLIPLHPLDGGKSTSSFSTDRMELASGTVGNLHFFHSHCSFCNRWFSLLGISSTLVFVTTYLLGNRRHCFF